MKIKKMYNKKDPSMAHFYVVEKGSFLFWASIKKHASILKAHAFIVIS